MPKPENGMPSTHSKGYPENSGHSRDRAAFHVVETQSPKGPLGQGYDVEAFVQKPRIFIGFQSECPSLSVVYIAEPIYPNHPSSINSKFHQFRLLG